MSSARAMTAAPARRIVIVEDEGILALSLERQLADLGYAVRGVAGDAEAALALVEREQPDLVLMDIRIQGPRDGIETAAEVHERFDVPVVYLTAHSDPRTIERAQQTQPMGYLLKPFKKADLQNVVAIALARSDSERQLRRREEALRVTLSCIDEAIVTTDLSGTVTSINPAVERLVGRDDEGYLNRPLAEVVPLRRHDGERLAEDPVASAQAKGRVQLEGRLDTGSGPRLVVGTAAALKHGQTSFGVVVALRDLTELLQARRQLEFSERLTALGTLAAGVAHEINNPLTVVLSNLSYALEEPVDPELHQALSDAQTAGLRVAHIVSDLRRFSKPQDEVLDVTDVRQALVTALSFTRSTWRTLVGVDLKLGAVPSVRASPTRITQVLVNLIINAVHAMRELPARRHRLTLVSGTDAQGRAVLSVRDTGPGVPDALRERIFEPFFTTKAEGVGTGLGLAVSRSIVENHGASLSLESDERGACFSIAFPPADAPPPDGDCRLVWLGEETVESDALHCTPLPADAPMARACLTTQPDVVVLALPCGAAEGLCRQVPELETVSVLVSAEEPWRGAIRLLPPFDAAALAVLQRRG